MTPGDYLQTVQQALLATVFVSNIGFWAENSYFDKAAFKPLLHLWSLGVEIQFYLFLPILFRLFNHYRPVIPILLVMSLLACFLVIGVSTKTAFFWLPFRIWEFLIGCCVAAFPLWRELPKWAGVFGLLIIIGVCTIKVDGFSPSIMTGHPGLSALAVSVATGVCLSAGLPDRFLRSHLSRVFERAGDYSYSIYLAHFPVIALLLYQPFAGTILSASGGGQWATLAFLLFVSSALLYKWVEQPFRKDSGAIWYAGMLVVSVPLIAWAGFYLQSRLVSKSEMRIYSAWFDRDHYRCGKLRRVINPTGKLCEIASPPETPSGRIMLVGNSHADSIKKSFAAEATARNLAVDFVVENNPLMSGGMSPEELISLASNRGVNAIVLHYSSQSISGEDIQKVGALAYATGIRLSYILPVPTPRENVPRSLLESLRHGTPINTITLRDYLRQERHLIASIPAGERLGIRYYSVADTFCNEECRLISDDGLPLYFDNHHLTLTGSDLLRPVFKKLITDMFN